MNKMEIDAFLYEKEIKKGFIYPFNAHTEVINVGVGYSKIVYEPSFLWRLPSSHKIENLPDNNNTRLNEGRFILSFLSFSYETDLRYSDWRREGRYKIPNKLLFITKKDKFSEIINEAFSFWNRINQRAKNAFTNAVFFLNKSKVEEVEYKRFMYGYVAIDCLWRLGCEVNFWEDKSYQQINLIKKLMISMFGNTFFTYKWYQERNGKQISHSNRIIRMCEEFGIPFEKDHVNHICTVRNNLMHEGKWSEFNPLGTGTIDQFKRLSEIEQLAERIIPRIMGFEPKYLKSSWRGMRTPLVW